jgi:histidine phosphotransfer protein HptB
MTGRDGGPIEVIIDPLLEELIPFFLEKRRTEIHAIESALAAGDLTAVRKIGHDLKGVGGSYGFDEISRLGLLIEQSAAQGDPSGAAAAVGKLRAYLDRLVVTYED